MVYASAGWPNQIMGLPELSTGSMLVPVPPCGRCQSLPQGRSHIKGKCIGRQLQQWSSA